MSDRSNFHGGSTLAIVLALLAGAGCRKQPGAMQLERPTPMVRTVQATAQDVPIYLDAIGKATAFEMVSIAPQVSGQVTQIHFKDGANLKKGDLLFTIDTRPFEAQRKHAEASLAESQAMLALGKSEFSRVQALLGTQSVSQQDFDQKKNALEVAEAQIKANGADVETAKLNLEYCNIRSPIDGRAGHRLVDPGNVVKANEGSMLVVQRFDPVYADFVVTERDLARVRKQMAEGTLKVQMRVPDQADPREGQLTFLDNAVQDGTGTVKLRATVPNSDHQFWPGQFVQVRLVLAVKKDAVLVPAIATQIGQQGQFVFVVKDDSTAEMRPIKPGQRQGDLMVIEDGLKVGERVIVEGQLSVMPGAKVRPQEGVKS